MRLLWKEWQQQKWIIIGGFLSGISFPMLECFYMWKRQGHFFTNMGGGILMACGAVFAIILAIATTHHDIRKGVDFFWQSKPVKPWKLLTIKFMLAAFLLGIGFLAVISLDLATRNISFAWTAFCYTYPIALLLFALSMLLMVITRDAAKAAFLAIWAGLLIYFLPLMFRGMEWMNVFEQMDSYRNPTTRFLFNVQFCHGKSISEIIRYILLIYLKGQSFDYIVFLAVMLAGSISFVVLSIKAMRYDWRWHPGQKSIVWTLGVSAAIIFGVSMFQVGHNLESVKELNGKPLINPVCYDWNYMPASLCEGLPEGDWIGSDKDYPSNSDALCIKDDLMFRFTTGYQSNKGVDQWKTKLIRHFVLQVYQFPFSTKNEVDSDKAPDFVIGAIKFFQTEPVIGRWTQRILGCFVRGDRLYAAYRPTHHKGDRGSDDYPGSLNPMYFVTFDISDPTLPKVVSNMEISNSDGFSGDIADIDGYCYITDSFQLIILSVENPDKPEIVGKVAFNDAFANMPEVLVGGTKKMELFPSGHLLIQENKLVCWSQSRITIFGIHDRLNPRVFYDDFFYDKDYLRGRIQEVAYKDNLLYVGTHDGIYILSLESDKTGLFTSRLVGQRRATPLEKFAGRSGGELLLSGNYLIEQAGSFGMLVYDVSNPSKPSRVYHAQVSNFANDIGFWNGLLYIQEYYYKMSFYQLLKNSNSKKEYTHD